MLILLKINNNFICIEVCNIHASSKYNNVTSCHPTRRSILSHTNPFDSLQSQVTAGGTISPLRNTFEDSYLSSDRRNVSANNSYSLAPTTVLSYSSDSTDTRRHSPIGSSTHALVDGSQTSSSLASTPPVAAANSAAAAAAENNVDFTTTPPEHLMGGLASVRYGPPRSPVSISSANSGRRRPRCPRKPGCSQPAVSGQTSIVDSLINSPMLLSSATVASSSSSYSTAPNSTDPGGSQTYLSWNSPQPKSAASDAPVQLKAVKSIIRKSPSVASSGVSGRCSSNTSANHVSFADSAEVLYDGRVSLCPLSKTLSPAPVHMSKPPYAEMKIRLL